MSDKLTTLTQLQKLGLAASEYTGNVAEAAAQAAEALDLGKVDKLNSTSVTIASSGWKNDSSDFPYYYDIADSSVTTADRADVTITSSTAVKFSPITETLSGKIRIRAKSAPSSDISAVYQILGGKS